MTTDWGDSLVIRIKKIIINGCISRIKMCINQEFRQNK